ncbi:MAG: zinc-ribbon domain-containing protein [Candidatus Saccharibacteria bacterium]
MVIFCSKCGNQLQPGAAFCGKCGNTITQNQTVHNDVVLHPAIADMGPKRVYLVIAGVVFSLLVIIGFGIIFATSPYNFADAAALICSEKSDDTGSCGVITSVSTHNINEIGKINATEQVAYREELIEKLKQKSASINLECTDTKAAESSKSMQDKTQAYYVDLCAADSSYLNLSASVLLRLYEKFPQAISGVNSFLLAQLDNGTYGGFQPKELDTGGAFTSTYSDLTMSSLMFTTQNIEKAKNNYENDIKANFHPKNTDYSYVYAHEVGHSMEYMLALKEVGFKDLLATSDPNDYYKLVEIWNGYDISTKIVKEAVKNAQSKQTSGGRKQQTESEMINDISGYAAEQDKNGKQLYPETLAEAVTDYLANGEKASELSLEIIPILSREMAKL